MDYAPTSHLLAGISIVAALATTGCDEKMLVTIDRDAPQVSITSPDADAVVSGVSFGVEVDATDDEGIERVEFSLGGASAVVLSSPPFAIRVVALQESTGTTVALVATAFDHAGNSAEASIDVVIAERTITQLTTAANDNANPAWSPDGTRIAFQAKRTQGTFDIWTMNADGSSQTRRTFNSQEDRNPAWSPDGNWIAFDSNRMGGFDIYRMPEATGEVDIEELTFGNNDDIEPAWGQAGAFLYFGSTRGVQTDSDVWRIPATGGDENAFQLTAFGEEDTTPALATDGVSLAFVTNLNFGAQGHVYLMDLTNLAVTPLTGDPGVIESDPSWFPGGGLLLFSRREGLDSNLWVQAVSGDIPLQITFGTGIVGDGGGAWSPDGSQIAFHSDRTGELQIYVME